MSTTVHIPEALLRRVDARARALHVSRNRLIVQTLETSLGARHAWPPELAKMLSEPLDEGAARALRETLSVVRSRRVNRRRPPAL